jgi:hypothetical protein
MGIETAWFPFLIITGLSLFLLSLVTLGVCYWLRRQRNLRARAKKEVVQTYRPLLYDWIAGEKPSLTPPDQRHNQIHLVALWNDIFRIVGSPERNYLLKAAEELKLASMAVPLLDSNKTEEQLTGVLTLARLGNTECIETIRRFTESSKPLLKMQSLKAMAVLEPREAVERIFDDLIANSGRPINYYLGVCRSIEIDLLADAVLGHLEEADPEAKPRIIPFLELVPNDDARDYICDTLAGTSEPEVLSACLKVLRKIGDPRLESLVAECLEHPAYFVRTQAARTLGSIGTSNVTEPLLEALKDPNWWVRYRAAESLVKLPSTTLPQLKADIATLNELESRNALEAAVAEVDL